MRDLLRFFFFFCLKIHYKPVDIRLSASILVPQSGSKSILEAQNSK